MFNALLVNNLTKIDNLIATCQRLNKLRVINLQPDCDTYSPLGAELSMLILAVIYKKQ